MRAYLCRIALLALVSRFAFIGLLARVIDTTLASEPVLHTIAPLSLNGHNIRPLDPQQWLYSNNWPDVATGDRPSRRYLGFA